MYSFEALKWVKNVKHEKGTSWAYSNFKSGDVFNLNWPKKFKANVLKPQIGDLILLFQSINNPKGVYLTHIVTPLNDVLLEDQKLTHPFSRLVGVVASPTILSSIPKPQDLDFFRPNRGACCHIDTIKERYTNSDIEISSLQKKIWELFHNCFEDVSIAFDFAISLQDSEYEYLEGREMILLGLHKFYERDPGAIKKAKLLAKQQNRFFCEVCSFDFGKMYPTLGNNYIECHHISPIATGGIRKTKVTDLAIVCANCHRMLHRKLKNKYLNISELRDLIRGCH